MPTMEIKQTKDECVDKLTSTEGQILEITANIKSVDQIDQVMQGYVARALNSKVGAEESELLLRLTNSWQGRCRDDLREIGKTPEYAGWKVGKNED